jgi:hypothetical protein
MIFKISILVCNYYILLLVHAVFGNFNNLYEFKTGFNNVID